MEKPANRVYQLGDAVGELRGRAGYGQVLFIHRPSPDGSKINPTDHVTGTAESPTPCPVLGEGVVCSVDSIGIMGALTEEMDADRITLVRELIAISSST